MACVGSGRAAARVFYTQNTHTNAPARTLTHNHLTFMFISLCFHPQSIAHFILRADADKAKPRSAPSAGSGAEKGEKGNGGVNKNMIYFNMKLTPEMQVTCDDVLCVTVTCDV